LWTSTRFALSWSATTPAGGDAIDGPVDVFLPRYRSVPEPESSAILGSMELAVADPRATAGSSTVTIVDIAADGYRLRLVDHPPAFDRASMYIAPGRSQ